MLPEFDACMACGQNNPHHVYSVGEHTLHALRQIEADKVLRLAVLFHDFGKPEVKTTDEAGVDHFKRHQEAGEKLAEKILRRLKFDNETIRTVTKLVWCHDYRPALTPARVRRAVNRIGEDLFPLYLKVQRADILAQNPKTQEPKLEALRKVGALYEKILKEKDCITLKQLAVSGRDLLEAGFAPGPRLGAVLQELLDLVLEEPGRNQKEWLLQEAVQKYGESDGCLRKAPDQ